ncbi:ribonuclease Z [Staphylothermus hellenicus]|uniref:Ribonuclease Z n=1 Tax=Staphylothermus hellenicus (strain DSM 12710 / JCM 10830 / BK20S6-10-b1 / P8) TaxID=591019 RepID=D7D972_STAHD|nr:ribonuclease Z [Staphylothermus hellenicus]ADI32318.1 beta-lactamase domain protein [Staphylothermus hellenicus DSM 12710]
MNAKIFMLGTGAAMPISRGLPCIALRIDSNIYLLDVGEGCQQRLFEAGLGLVKIKTIMITHLHGDHYLGLFGMFQSMHLSNRKNELYLIAPAKLKDLLKKFIELGLAKIAYPIYFVEAKEGELYRDNKISVEAFKVVHGIEAYGYKLTLKNGKRIVYTGDTKPFEDLESIAKNADILVHEATFTSDLREEAWEQGHSTAADAAITAYKANVKELVLTHISSRYKDAEPLYVDAYRYFRNVVVAEDYMVIYL